MFFSLLFVILVYYYAQHMCNVLRMENLKDNTIYSAAVQMSDSKNIYYDKLYDFPDLLYLSGIM